MEVLNNLTELFKYSDKVLFVIAVLMLLAERVWLFLLVRKLAKKKELYNDIGYAGVAAAFGVLGYIIFLLVTLSSKSKAKPSKQQITTPLIFAAICLVLVCHIVNDANNNRLVDCYGFNSTVGIYENENGEKVRYNDKGWGYCLENMDAFSLAYKDGKREIIDFSKDDNFGDYLIGNDGYLYNDNFDFIYVWIEDDLPVAIDGKGNIYYKLKNCFFDKDGKFVLDNAALKDVTYDSLVSKLRSIDSKYEHIFKNDNGLYAFYDKNGNEYDLCNKSAIRYYDAENKSYRYINEVSDDKYNCYYEDENGNKLYRNAFIDEDGYIVFKDGLNSYIKDDNHGGGHPVLYDSNGKLYYYPDYCYWDKNGKLVLSEYISDVTYEQIMCSEQFEE